MDSDALKTRMVPADSGFLYEIVLEEDEKTAE